MNPEDALQSCMDEVLAGRKTPAECAALYPRVEGLEAGLNAALALRAVRQVTLGAAASQRIEARLRQQAAARPPARPPARPALAPRWLLGPALAAVLLLGGLAGSAAAASASNPGDPLYGLKRADESAQVWLSPASSRAEVFTGLARHRLDELTVVLQRAQPDANTLNNLSTDLTTQTQAALAAVDQAPRDRQTDILNRLVRLTDEQQTVLATAQKAAPAEAQMGLEQALEASGQGHTAAIQRLAQGPAADQLTETPTATVPAATATSTATSISTTTASSTASATPTATGTVTPVASATPSASATPLPSATASATPRPPDTATATPRPPDTAEPTHVPPGRTKIPPGKTKIPPGQTKIPPGHTHVPPEHTHAPPKPTHVPPGETHAPPEHTHVPPEKTKIPPGHDKTPKPTKPGDETDD